MSYVCTCGSDNKGILKAVPYSVALDCALIISNTAPSSIFFKLPFTQTVLTIYGIACWMIHSQNTSDFIKDIKDKFDDLSDKDSSYFSKIGSFFGLLKTELNFRFFHNSILSKIDDYSWDNFCLFFRYDIRHVIVSSYEKTVNPKKPDPKPVICRMPTPLNTKTQEDKTQTFQQNKEKPPISPAQQEQVSSAPNQTRNVVQVGADGSSGTVAGGSSEIAQDPDDEIEGSEELKQAWRDFRRRTAAVDERSRRLNLTPNFLGEGNAPPYVSPQTDYVPFIYGEEEAIEEGPREQFVPPGSTYVLPYGVDSLTTIDEQRMHPYERERQRQSRQAYQDYVDRLYPGYYPPPQET